MRQKEKAANLEPILRFQQQNNKEAFHKAYYENDYALPNKRNVGMKC